MKLLGPALISAAGKLAGAARDLSPLLFFGIGADLDAVVIAVFVGTTVAAMATNLVLPVCVPLMARHDARGTTLARRIVIVVGVIAVGSLLGSSLILTALGAEDPSRLRFLHGAALAAGLLQTSSVTQAARLYATGTSHVGLALPFFGGVFVPPLLLLQPTLTSLGIGLVLGALVDKAVMTYVVRRSSPPHEGRNGTTGGGPAPEPRVRVEYVVGSQIASFAIIAVERGLVARGPTGVIGAVAVCSRSAGALLSVVAGSIEPQLYRRLGSGSAGGPDGGLSRLMHGSRIVGLGATCALLLSTFFLSAIDASFIVSAAVLYTVMLPPAGLYRATRASLLGCHLFRRELVITSIGGLFTVGIAATGLALGEPLVLMLSIPLSSSLMAYLGSRLAAPVLLEQH